MFDFDPEWMHGDDDFIGSDNGFDPENREIDPAFEDGDVSDALHDHFLYGAAAFGLGDQMARDEIEEREIAERILKEREKKAEEPEKISLHSRKKGKNKHKMNASERWMADVATGRKSVNDPVEYTQEEYKAGVKKSIEDNFEW